MQATLKVCCFQKIERALHPIFKRDGRVNVKKQITW